jgi:hypothetical protein
MLVDSLNSVTVTDTDEELMLEQARISLSKLEETLKRIQQKKSKRQPQYEVYPIDLNRIAIAQNSSAPVVQ